MFITWREATAWPLLIRRSQQRRAIPPVLVKNHFPCRVCCDETCESDSYEDSDDYSKRIAFDDWQTRAWTCDVHCLCNLCAGRGPPTAIVLSRGGSRRKTCQCGSWT